MSGIQFTTNHACLSGEQFLRASSLHPPPAHTKEHAPLGPSSSDYQDYHHHHQHPPLGRPNHHQHYQPHSLRLETFDPGFQLPSTQGLGLLPMPVAYEDFQYALPALELPDQGVPTRPGDLLASHPDSVYQTYPHGGVPYGQDYRLSLPTGWDVSPASRERLPSPNMTHDLILNNFLNESHPSAPSHPPPPPAPIESSSSTSTRPYSDHCFHDASCIPSHAALMSYPPPNPPTPPPLFDASEQDLLSSFLNILGDPNGECDFDPQGMPEGMPVLGELKRRLEECGHDGPVRQHVGKRETDEMGRQVKSRLKISESEYSHLRRPSLQSFQTTSGSLSSSSDSHLYQEQDALSRKKPKTSNTSSTHLDPSHPFHIPEVPHHGGVELESDVEMRNWNRNPRCETGQWPDQLLLGHDPLSSQSTYHHQVRSSKPTLAQSLSPVFPTNGSPNNPDKGTFDGPSAESTDPAQEDQSSVRPAAKRPAKPAKSTHIVSEQRRRNAIQGGFGSLVEILRAGEAQSGISIATPDLPSHPSGQAGATTAQNNKKPKTRGRGRRGEIETGASKSVVLERAAEFVQWMADGNFALVREIQRVESILQNYGIQV